MKAELLADYILHTSTKTLTDEMTYQTLQHYIFFIALDYYKNFKELLIEEPFIITYRFPLVKTVNDTYYVDYTASIHSNTGCKPELTGLNDTNRRVIVESIRNLDDCAFWELVNKWTDIFNFNFGEIVGPLKYHVDDNKCWFYGRDLVHLSEHYFIQLAEKFGEIR